MCVLELGMIKSSLSGEQLSAALARAGAAYSHEFGNSSVYNVVLHVGFTPEQHIQIDGLRRDFQGELPGITGNYTPLVQIFVHGSNVIVDGDVRTGYETLDGLVCARPFFCSEQQTIEQRAAVEGAAMRVRSSIGGRVIF